MKKDLIIFLSIIFFSMLFEFVGWLDPLRNLGQKIIIPMSSFNVSIVEKISRPYDYIKFTFTKSRYLKQIESNYAKALTQLNELDELKAQNEELKKLLGASDRRLNEETIIGAPILSLAYPAVGVGFVDGVQENDMVLIDNVLVGTIDSVFEHQSRVSLLNSKRKNRILVRTQSGIEGVIDGDGRNVLLTHIPRSVELEEGERVMTVGQEGIEKNVFVGVVKKMNNSPSDSTNTYVINQLVAFYNAILVEVK